MSIETQQQPPLRPGDLVRFIKERDHIEVVLTCGWIADAKEFVIEGGAVMLTAAEERFLQTRDRILARRNPELLKRENAEIRQMSDEELRAMAGLPAPMIEGFDNPSFYDRYGADVTEAATGLLIPDAGVTSSDDLWLKWCEHDRLIGEADERASKEAGGVFDLYKALREELWAPIFDRLDEVEERIANMVPTTVQDCLAQIRLLKARWDCEPGELDDRLVDNLLAGVEVMANAGS
jgi:hypothetical protein